MMCTNMRQSHFHQATAERKQDGAQIAHPTGKDETASMPIILPVSVLAFLPINSWQGMPMFAYHLR